MLTFLHLSDIHFSDLDGPEGERVDERVRELMLEDIERMAKRLGPMDAILVVGDVASKGQEGEYRLASDFVDRVAELIGCERENVACVPGNHDIDRDAHDAIHEAVRRSLRTVPPEEVSASLHRLLREEHGARVLLDPLAEYNRFALQYGCAIDHGQIVWAPKAFDLDGRELLVHGASSAWICDATDSDKIDGHRVVVGDFQCCQIAPRPETVSLAMVHHPVNWVRDSERVQPWLNRAQVALTGHEHAAGVELDPDGRRVTMASGAVTPERTERGWVPAYNVLRLELKSGAELDLQIFVRCWQRDVAEFGPDGRFRDPYPLKISLGPAAGRAEEEELPQPPEDMPAPEPEPIDSPSSSATSARHCYSAARCSGVPSPSRTGAPQPSSSTSKEWCPRPSPSLPAEWGDRRLEDVFEPVRVRDPDGRTVEQRPLSWELIGPASRAMKGLGDVDICQVVNRTLSVK